MTVNYLIYRSVCLLVAFATFVVLSYESVYAITDTIARVDIQDTTVQIRSFNASNVVVSASRWQERASTVSRQITSIRANDVRLRNPGTSADALECSGEVFVQRSQQAGGSPRLRGFAANSVLMVVDGIRMNNAIYRSGNLQNLIQIDANTLASAEVLFGPGSVQYGSDALGGVMVFSLKQPFYSSDGFNAHASSMARYASAANERTLHVDLDLQWERFAMYTSVTGTQFGDLRAGSTFSDAAPDFGRRLWTVQRMNGRDSQVVNPSPLVQVASGYDQLNVLHKMRVKASDVWDVQYTGIFTTSSNIPRYDRLVEERVTGGVRLPRSAEWYYGPQVWLAQSVVFSGSLNSAAASNVVVTLGHQLLEESRNTRNFQSDWLRSQNERLNIFTLNADAQLQLGNSPSYGEVDVYYGIEASHQSVQSTARERSITRDTSRPAATRYPDGGSTYTTLAAYTQLRWDVHPDVTLSGGVRATSVQLSAHNTPESAFSLPFTTIEMSPVAITGSIGTVWNASSLISLRANVATGFRAPNVDDAAKVFESEPGRIVLPNPNIGPVYVTTAEGGIAVTPWSWITLRGTVFRSWLTDALEKRIIAGADSVHVNGTQLLPMNVQNVGTGRLAGVHLAAELRWGNLSVVTSATYTEGRDEANDVPLEHVIPAFGLMRISWQPLEGLQCEGDMRWSAAWRDSEISPADRPLVGITIPPGGQPSWTVFGVRCTATVWQGLAITAGIENILDQHYRPAQSGISAPGSNVVLSVRWN